MCSSNRKYEDIVKPRREGCSDFMWASRELRPKYAWERPVNLNPDQHKFAVLKSSKMQNLLEKLAREDGVSKEELEKQVAKILEEIGYKKNLKVCRWLGVVLAKIFKKVTFGVFVNTLDVQQIKGEIGHCPVIFVPSHRSYGDFILMSYVCFNEDLVIPAIAAGMDFHGMAGVGNMLRNTGAFFMRRSYTRDSLYWTAFRQYVYQLVTNGSLPIEFFIEGTRSRTGKSLIPKYGLLLMVLKAFFIAAVPDILFIPINISYDRVLEEKLFAFELLGVPKPKETTKGFFKSLTILKEKYGKIFVDFARPISVKEYFGDKLDRSVHSTQPLYQQELTDYEKSLIPSLAHEIVYKQQKHCVVTTFNLVATTLNCNLATGKLLHLTDFIEEVSKLRTVMDAFGGFMDDGKVEDCFEVHQNLIGLNENEEVSLIWNDVVLDKLDPCKLKAHNLSERTISFAVPYVMLQTYVNPIMHYLIDCAILVVIIQHSPDTDSLFKNYTLLRSLLNQDFVTHESRTEREFGEGLSISLKLDLIKNNGSDGYLLGGNEHLRQVFCTILDCFIYTYYITSAVLLMNVPRICDEKSILALVQELVESKINSTQDFVHPYCLSLDTITNCLNSLTNLKALIKRRENDNFVYEINEGAILNVRDFLEKFVKTNYVNHDLDNLRSKL